MKDTLETIFLLSTIFVMALVAPLLLGGIMLAVFSPFILIVYLILQAV